MWYVFYIEKDKSRATFELCYSIASAYTKGKQWVLKKTIEKSNRMLYNNLNWICMRNNIICVCSLTAM